MFTQSLLAVVARELASLSWYSRAYLSTPDPAPTVHRQRLPLKTNHETPSLTRPLQNQQQEDIRHRKAKVSDTCSTWLSTSYRSHRDWGPRVPLACMHPRLGGCRFFLLEWWHSGFLDSLETFPADDPSSYFLLAARTL